MITKRNRRLLPMWSVFCVLGFGAMGCSGDDDTEALPVENPSLAGLSIQGKDDRAVQTRTLSPGEPWGARLVEMGSYTELWQLTITVDFRIENEEAWAQSLKDDPNADSIGQVKVLDIELRDISDVAWTANEDDVLEKRSMFAAEFFPVIEDGQFAEAYRATLDLAPSKIEGFNTGHIGLYVKNLHSSLPANVTYQLEWVDPCEVQSCGGCCLNGRCIAGSQDDACGYGGMPCKVCDQTAASVQDYEYCRAGGICLTDDQVEAGHITMRVHEIQVDRTLCVSDKEYFPEEVYEDYGCAWDPFSTRGNLWKPDLNVDGGVIAKFIDDSLPTGRNRRSTYSALAVGLTNLIATNTFEWSSEEGYLLFLSSFGDVGYYPRPDEPTEFYLSLLISDLDALDGEAMSDLITWCSLEMTGGEYDIWSRLLSERTRVPCDRGGYVDVQFYSTAEADEQ